MKPYSSATQVRSPRKRCDEGSAGAPSPVASVDIISMHSSHESLGREPDAATGRPRRRGHVVSGSHQAADDGASRSHGCHGTEVGSAVPEVNPTADGSREGWSPSAADSETEPIPSGSESNATPVVALRPLSSGSESDAAPVITPDPILFPTLTASGSAVIPCPVLPMPSVLPATPLRARSMHRSVTSSDMYLGRQTLSRRESTSLDRSLSTSFRVCWKIRGRDPGDAADPTDVDMDDDGGSQETLARGLLPTAGLMWVALPCRSPRGGTNSPTRDPVYQEAQRCRRTHARRDALANPLQMAMPQETRERIQKEVTGRKTSLSRKVSQYFKAIYTDDYEVDLV